MGWAITYEITVPRQLTPAELRALETLELRPAKNPAEVLREWGPLLYADDLKALTGSSTWKEPDSPPSAPPQQTQFEGFLQIRSDAQFRKIISKFREVETLLPDAEVRLRDDYALREPTRPRDIKVA